MANDQDATAREVDLMDDEATDYGDRFTDHAVLTRRRPARPGPRRRRDNP